MAEWDSVPKDSLIIIAEHIDSMEDLFNFCLVCKSWQSVSSLCGKRSRTLPPRCPWVMLPDIAEMNFPKVTKSLIHHQMLIEEIEKNENIVGMNKRRFFSFSTSKTYEFELPEATRRQCFGVGHGWLMTIGYDLQINLLHPFSRQQVGLPHFLSFKHHFEYDEEYTPQFTLTAFVKKAVMSSNPYDDSSNKDCIVLAIYGQHRLLAFARPGDKDWTDICPHINCYQDVIYYQGKFYAIDDSGIVVVFDIQNVQRPKVTPLVRLPKEMRDNDNLYLVESSGSLLVVVRSRRGPNYDPYESYDSYVPYDHSHVVIVRGGDIEEDDFDDSNDIVEEDDDDDEKRVHYTVDFSIFKLEECNSDRIIVPYPYRRLGEDLLNQSIIDENGNYAYPYKLIPVKNLGDKSLFLGQNASASIPASSNNNVKANHIYFSEDDGADYGSQPYGGGPDTGSYDVESRRIKLHCASNFKSHLTPPLWYI